MSQILDCLGDTSNDWEKRVDSVRLCLALRRRHHHATNNSRFCLSVLFCSVLLVEAHSFARHRVLQPVRRGVLRQPQAAHALLHQSDQGPAIADSARGVHHHRLLVAARRPAPRALRRAGHEPSHQPHTEQCQGHGLQRLRGHPLPHRSACSLRGTKLNLTKKNKDYYWNCFLLLLIFSTHIRLASCRRLAAA